MKSHRGRYELRNRTLWLNRYTDLCDMRYWLHTKYTELARRFHFVQFLQLRNLENCRRFVVGNVAEILPIGRCIWIGPAKINRSSRTRWQWYRARHKYHNVIYVVSLRYIQEKLIFANLLEIRLYLKQIMQSILRKSDEQEIIWNRLLVNARTEPRNLSLTTRPETMQPNILCRKIWCKQFNYQNNFTSSNSFAIWIMHKSSKFRFPINFYQPALNWARFFAWILSRRKEKRKQALKLKFVQRCDRLIKRLTFDEPQNEFNDNQR